ncbi:Histidine ammonia-lyase [Rhodovulum sp. P5]|uniref:HAL/PAL/TAL family ammonia-lyase n=1 Tax=Rhodovulum sp. P5 TaxID=1564506 RepID=UPI0009C3195D|nr:aromatic amino acid ammonia-lyase [Rhodovulum sp. P5]ARE42213.1 Histidine ammonia-lyase [Rhodovulum sp. P5]
MRHDRDSAALYELDDRIDLSNANAVAQGDQKIVLSGAARARCRAAEARLVQAISERRHIYGITTGFGPLANRLVSPEDGVRLQQNLVHHLATGLGPDLGWAEARAVVLARLASLSKGASGASEASINALVTLLNSDLAPAIPARGTVGASGDLTPLAHMVLCFQGRGAFFDRAGKRFEGAVALDLLGLAPLDLSSRDGLALVNGTSAMTGIALRNAQAAERSVDWALALTALMGECFDARSEAWSAEFADLRPHGGQIRAAATLRARLKGSARIVEARTAARRLEEDDIRPEDEPGQDAYSLRVAPQLIGAVLDALDWHNSVLETELNAVTDNPIFPANGDVPALHGGNFMGQHVALISDTLANSTTVLAGLVERQVARLTDEKLNRGLPAFLHRGPCGLNSGFMGAQVTATALLAEMRATGAASVQSLSTNGANQDVVSMGTIAARLTAEKLARCIEIQAILALALAQAAELRGGSELSGFSGAARRLVAWVRETAPELEEDRPLAKEITALSIRMSQQSPTP